MTIDDYNLNKELIIKLTELQPNEFFDFEFSPKKEEYLKAFRFYSETLVQNSYYGVSPSYIFFRNNYGLNARATRTDNNIFLIGINMGTVNWLIENFKLNEKLIKDTDIKLFEVISKHTDTSINNLMFQAGLHFTFYHEFAHLVQNSNYLENSLDENPSQIDNFEIQRHLLEVDADTFSALCLGSHIMQYSDKLFGDDVNQVSIEAMIILILIPIVFYLLSFEGNKSEFYLREKTHPHPSIRLISFIMSLIQYCNDTLSAKSAGFKVNERIIFEVAMSIAEDLQLKFFDDKKVTNFIKILTKNRPQLISYLGELATINKILKFTSVYQWNQHRA